MWRGWSVANSLLRERDFDRIAKELVPGCRTHFGYRITSDDFEGFVSWSDADAAVVHFRAHELALSSNDFAMLLKSRLPPEWFSKPSTIEPIDFDATG